MAHSAVQGPQGSVIAGESQFGAWNPAHRPENGLHESTQYTVDEGNISDSSPKANPPHSDGSIPPPVSSDDGSGEIDNSEETDVSNASTGNQVMTDAGIQNSDAVPPVPTRAFTSTDLFESIEVSTRTNSFPDIYAHPQTAPQDASAKNDTRTNGEQAPLPTSMSGFDHSSKTDNTNTVGWDNSHDDGGEEGYDFFGQLNSQTKPIYVPPEAESRFEEGVPLVSNGETSPTQAKPTDTIGAIFEADEPTDADFFNSDIPSNTEPPSQEAPPIHRKTTSDVLSTLGAGFESPERTAPPDSALSSDQLKFPAGETNTPGGNSGLNGEVGEDELAERWAAVLDDDDLLVEDEGADVEPSADLSSEGFFQERDMLQTTHTMPGAPREAQYPMNNFTPHQPSSSEMLGGLSTASFAHPAQNPPNLQNESKVESFSNQSKAGYKSPYDLPFEMRPKHPPIRSASHPVGVNPPLRSSSMTETRPSTSSLAVPPPPMNSSAAIPAPGAGHAPGSQPATGSFFEELPPPKRPSTRGRYTPQQNIVQTPHVPHPPPPHVPHVPQTGSEIPHPPAPQQTADLYSQYQLQPPAPMDPYASLSVPSTAQTAPASSSRYSPKPPAVQSGPKPPASPRYSPVPLQPATSAGAGKYVSQPPVNQQSASILPFQPRTSSPLAQPDSSTVEMRDPSQQTHVTSPLKPQVIQSAPELQFTPPRRSQTQSPGNRFSGQPSLPANRELPRPASTHGPRQSLPTSSLQSSFPAATDRRTTPQLDFIPPTDGMENDPLERWKGAPIFKFGFGGSAFMSFPKHVPRYTAGNPAPRIKPTLGEIKSCPVNQVLAVDQTSEVFPGPLRTKSKKKDVLTWLSGRISALESSQALQTDPKQQSRLEEIILLWKVVRVVVEHDGMLRDNSAAETALQAVLSRSTGFSEASPGYNAAPEPTSLHGDLNATLQAEPRGTAAAESIYKTLLAGDRNKAVWDAVDHRLWGHAMLLSSTLDKSVWKQVAQEFIRREVRSLGKNTEPLAALYEVLAGNFEESIDELVPPSARAGLQMVSMHSSSEPTKNALEGLDKWRETVCLILKNRSPQDDQALLALSRLLASYGRAEASHICALIAGPNAGPIFGGINDQAHIVLLGADPRRLPSPGEHSPSLLTEIYEFAVSVLASPPLPILPHLQAFKLQHAASLAEEGHHSIAQQYCDAIGATVKASTKSSPYYNHVFFSGLDELANRLRQTPADDSSSWISRPSMEKVSGSMWAKFNSFVAGEDNDAASPGAGKGVDGDVGPFAKVTGTPSISRSPSLVDGYGSYFPPSQQPASAMSSTSRYAPGGPYQPHSSPDQLRGRRSLDAQGSPSRGVTGRPYSQRRHSQDPTTSKEHHVGANSDGLYSSPMAMAANTMPPQSQYGPLAPVKEAYSPQVPTPTDGPPPLGQAYFPQGQEPGTLIPNGQATMNPVSAESSYEPPSLSTGYAPPSYEPPSYQPEPADNESSEDEKPKKKKSFMDEDDGDLSRASELRAAEKAAHDKAAAEAVKKAAEEDAKRPPPGEKKGWFSGWFSKKDSGTGPIKAQLGEESSFYYDNELKRWVNKNDPDSAKSAASALPPPPKGSAPASRSASGGQPSPLSPPNAPTPGTSPLLVPPRSSGTAAARSISPFPATPPLGSLEPPSGLMPPMPRSVSAGSPGGPPSRPGTSLSNASSIDDLLGAPQARKGGTMKTRRKGRGYVDVMAK